MGFNVNEVYQQGNSLKAADLNKREVKVTINDIQLATIPDNGREKRMLELHFKGTEKTLLLNRTNSDTISYVLGPDTDAWMGKSIILYPTMVSFQGKQVEAIRIRMEMQRAEGFEQQNPAQAFHEAEQLQGNADHLVDDLPPSGADYDDIPFN